MSAPRPFRVTVFCGSRSPADPSYDDAARALGAGLAQLGAAVVYGGAGVGTMRVLADAALDAGGVVLGVIPDELEDREVAHTAITELHIVDSIAERKTLLIELADVFVALPGGLGTLDELFEVAVRAQVGLHDKPIYLVNLAGYYDHLCAFFDHAVAVGLMRDAHRGAFRVVPDVPAVLDAVRAHRATPRPSADAPG